MWEQKEDQKGIQREGPVVRQMDRATPTETVHRITDDRVTYAHQMDRCLRRQIQRH